MSLPQYRKSPLSILIFAVLTTYFIFTGKANMFFLIYIFWWDEFIQTIFGLFNYFFRKSRIENLSGYAILLKGRFFMLFVYFIFIVVIFGFMLALKSDTQNAMTTFRILFFLHWEFDLVLLLIIIREAAIYLSSKDEKISGKNLSFSALVTLHVSIVLGVFLWTFASGRFEWFNLNFGEDANKFIILPFIIIKLIFDLLKFKSNKDSHENQLFTK